MSDVSNRPAALADQVLEFDTPENVVFGYQIAGIGSRFLAAVVDTFLILVLQVVVNLTLIFIVALAGGPSLLESGLSGDVSVVVGVFGLLAFAFLWGYYIFFELLWNGQSPGKRLVGLRVITQNGAPIDVAAAIIRNLVRIVDFLPLYYGLGVLSMFIDTQSRRLGDFAAGTVVVYDQGEVTLNDLERSAARLNASRRAVSSSGGLPLHLLTPAHVAMAQRFVSRQSDLHNAGQLALFLARRLLAAMNLPEPSLTEAQALNLLRTVAKEPGRPQGSTRV